MGACPLSKSEGLQHDFGSGRDVSGGAQKPSFVLAATGLRAEARIAARVPNVRAVAGGGDAGRLEQLIRQEIVEGAQGIISFGIAAGLRAGKGPGTCVVGREIAHGELRYSTDQAWAARLRSAIHDAELATIAGVDRPLQSPAEKHALYAATGAVAADMESHIAARLSAEHGLPFVMLRVIADPATRAVPPAALAGMGKDGRVDVWAVLASLARAPGRLPAMLRLAADTRRAMAELFRCHRLLGPGFGFFDLG
jgi:adenosylhomocysteine nucleosidase